MDELVVEPVEVEVDPQAVAACERVFTRLGIAGDEKTPRRYVRALAELTRGVGLDPRRHLEVTFPPAQPDPGLITVREVPFTSVCAHHMLPFYGAATVAYLPKPEARIVGLSKLARLVQEYAARPQVQEQLAAEVLDALTSRLHCRGAAIGIRAVHTCMALRGAATGPGASMVTVDHVGELGQQPWRQEFAAALAG